MVTDKQREMSKELTEKGFKFLDEIADNKVCENRACLRCRLADILFEVENKYQSE